MACPEGELSLLIVDDAQIASLNQQYRGRTGPTNVLAFSMNEGAFAQVAPHLLGDVVISMETCVREAEEAGLDLRDHFDELLIHGILHLFGYDHETSPQEAARMEAMSMKLLRELQGNRKA